MPIEIPDFISKRAVVRPDLLQETPDPQTDVTHVEWNALCALAGDTAERVNEGAAGGGITQLTGDVVAGPGIDQQAATVVAIQGLAVTADAPTAGDVLASDGEGQMAWSGRLTDALVHSEIPGTHPGTLTRTNEGGVVARRVVTDYEPPTTSADSSEGFGEGSLWFVLSESIVAEVYICLSADDGAANWQRIGSGNGTSDLELGDMPAPPPVARASSGGSSPSAAREDHTHGSSLMIDGSIALDGPLVDLDLVIVYPGVKVALPYATANEWRTWTLRKQDFGQVPFELIPQSGETVNGRSGSYSPPLASLPAHTDWLLRARDAGEWECIPKTTDYVSPHDILTNKIAYWRAEASNAIVSDRVSEVADRFGSTRKLEQSTAGNRPLYMPNGGPGGRPAWRFLSSRQDRLVCAHDAGQSGVDWSAVVLARLDSNGTRLILNKCAGNVARPLDLQLVRDTQSLGNAGEASSSSGQYATGSWCVYGVTRAGGGTSRVFVDGLVAEEAASAVHTNSGDPIWLGYRPDTPGSGFAFEGRVACLALWNRALSRDEIAAVSLGLRNEYGLI